MFILFFKQNTAYEVRISDGSSDVCSSDLLPGWRDDALAEALPPFLKSCDRLTRQPAERAVGPGGIAGTVADWQDPCAAAERKSVVEGKSVSVRGDLAGRRIN